MCNISDRFKYFDKIKFYDLKEKDEDFIHIQKKIGNCSFMQKYCAMIILAA